MTGRRPVRVVPAARPGQAATSASISDCITAGQHRQLGRAAPPAYRQRSRSLSRSPPPARPARARHSSSHGHGGPLLEVVSLADAQHLPQGRHQAGDRHLNFHETRDNLTLTAAAIKACTSPATTSSATICGRTNGRHGRSRPFSVEPSKAFGRITRWPPHGTTPRPTHLPPRSRPCVRTDCRETGPPAAAGGRHHLLGVAA